MNIDNKFQTYCRLVQSQQDIHGFVASDECDSLLFTALLGCVPGISVNIKAAMASDGSWQRRPTDLAPCCTLDHWSLWDRLKQCLADKTLDPKMLQSIFERGGSSISRDMFVGLAWYAYWNRRLDISESVIQYALKHKCIMGVGTPTRTLLTPGLLSTYAWISYRLGGPNRWWLRWLPQSESSKLTGFQAHLSVLHILLRNRLTDKIKYQSVLKAHAAREPNNALFQIAADNIVEAFNLLENQTWWPQDRLPTSNDRHEQWLFQRDYSTDWLPDSENKQHSGADFLFCYWLLDKHNEG